MFYYFTALITFTFKPHTRRQQKKYLKSENQEISRPHTRTKRKKKGFIVVGSVWYVYLCV